MTGRTPPPGAAPVASRAPASAPDHESAERRSFVAAGIALAGVLVLLVIAAAVFSGGAGDERRDGTATTEACASGDTVCEAAGAEVERPGIIPQPGSGRAPEDSGDPGGALQIAVLVLIVLGLGTIVALVVRSGRRARRTALARAAGGPSAEPS